MPVFVHLPPDNLARRQAATAGGAAGDVYGIGVLAFQALAGREPWPETLQDAQLDRERFGVGLPRLSAFLRRDSPAPDEVIARLLDLDPARRGTARDAARDLASVVPSL